jgi:multiple sugar transport system permease protein
MTASAAPTAIVRRKPPAAVRRKRMLVSVANHSLLIAVAIAFLAPFVFIVLTSLMTSEQALSSDLWPHPFRFRNFIDVFTTAPLWRWTLNTMLYSCLATIGVIVSSVPVAYALARLERAGRRLHGRPRRTDAAAAGLRRAAVRDVGEAAPRWDAVAADRAELVR